MTLHDIVAMIRDALLVRESMTITRELADERSKNIAQILYPLFDQFIWEKAEEEQPKEPECIFDPRD